MGYIFTDSELKSVLKSLKKIENIQKKKDFDELDYEMIVNALRRSPMNKYLPEPMTETEALLTEENTDNHTCLIMLEGKKLQIPSSVNPIFEYGVTGITRENISFNKKKIKLIDFEKLVREIIEFMNKRKSLYDEVEKNLRNADKFYDELREMIKKIEDEYDDNFMESVFILPDLFVYLCRLLKSKDISDKYKVKLIIAILYIVSPIDVIPECIFQAVGYVDDVMVAINTIMDMFSNNSIPREVMIDLWPGRIETIDKLDYYYGLCKEVLGDELENIIQHVLREKVKAAT